MRVLYAIIRADRSLSTLGESESYGERDQRVPERAHLPLRNIQANDRSYTRVRERTEPSKAGYGPEDKTVRTASSAKSRRLVEALRLGLHEL